MKNPTNAFFLLLAVIFSGCWSKTEQEQQQITKGDQKQQSKASFNAQNSDKKAIAIADSAIQAMGGEQAWHNTRYLQWNFFGKRELLWDKNTDRVKIYVPQENLTIHVDLVADTGNVFQDGEITNERDSVEQYLQKGEQMWANDSYWLIIPFKLKDHGVQLSYMGDDTLDNGQKADVIEVTFNKVGFTPQNKYHVYIDQDRHLVRKWAYFQKADQSEPSMVTPWADYERYGDLLLSSKRGKLEISELAVFDSLPAGVFAKAGPYRQ
ncbi:MAG: hypothetical protein BRD50_08575 [Bacteroidetes bacterium SW_11_45_7]|nr:MAG: hypothetical protein BRD50_08575 [Bacteroidetes bacterium SW_11_45_7]